MLNAEKELIVILPHAQRAAGWCKAVVTDNKPRSGAERLNAVSRYGLPRYHGRRFDGISQSGFGLRTKQGGTTVNSSLEHGSGALFFEMRTGKDKRDEKCEDCRRNALPRKQQLQL